MKKIALIAAAFAVFALQASAQQDGFVPSPKGALVKNITNNAGPKIKLNDVITFNVIQKTEKDSILFDTYKAGQPVKIQVQPSQNIADLMDVFPFLAAKDSAVIKIPSDSIFKGHETERPPFLPKGSMIVVNLKIERVQSLDDAMAERNKAVDSLNMVEKGEIDGYIAKNKLLVKTTADGLRYRIIQP
ncbi:MAG: peptidylprolyl isomerase, partial [Bacteroidetes bacterium]|nr:peptidylprolyl isomerase [Bacteroidota bacterium]